MILVKVRSMFYTPKDEGLFENVNWQRFTLFKNVFNEKIGWNHFDNCGQFRKIENEKIHIDYNPILAKDFNLFLNHFKCILV